MRNFRHQSRLFHRKLFSDTPGSKASNKDNSNPSPSKGSGSLTWIDLSSCRVQKTLSTTFAALLCVGLFFWALGQRDWLPQGDWRHSYGVTEWMINYQGGFLRRGLPGEVLLFIGRKTGLDIGWFVIFLCLILYGAYFLIILREPKGSLPEWALYSGPLLGYPIYSGDIIRKDIPLLLCLIALLKAITRLRLSPFRQVLIGIISGIAILSHELFFFFGTPLSRDS